MKLFLSIFLYFSIICGVFGQFRQNIISSNEINTITAAIYRIENSKKYPYGIKSIKIQGNNEQERIEYARKICYNTVNNNICRFRAQTNYFNFFEFLGSRYAPTKGATDDPNKLNNNWVRNLQSVLGQEFVNKINKKLTEK